MTRENYFERCRRACLKVVSDHKKRLRAMFMVSKNQGNLFPDGSDEAEELKLAQSQWFALDEFERDIKFHKGVRYK